MPFDPGQPRDRLGRWSDTAAGMLATDGGFTFRVNGERVTSGFAVAEPPPGGRRDWLRKKGVTAADLDKFVNDHSEELRDPRVAVGGWRDPEGDDVIDVSKVTHKREAAGLALAGRQHSVYDLDRGVEVATRDLLADALADQPEGMDVHYGGYSVVRQTDHGDLRSVGGNLPEFSGGTGRPTYTVQRLDAEGNPYGGSKRFRRGGTPWETLANWLWKKVGGEAPMEAALSNTIVTPSVAGEFDFAKHEGRLAFWKQILPKKSIHYTAKDGKRQTLDFTDEYLADLANHKAVDTIGFLLADKDNAHTMDPERWRGEVVGMEVRDDGLYGKIVFPSADAAKVVIENPNLGVSARIREGVPRSDGSTVPRGIIHVLGTLDPQVSGMSPWQIADLSAEQGELLDLSNETYEETTVADEADTETKTLSDYTEAEIDAMTEEELDKFLAEFVPEFDNYTGADADEDGDDPDDEAEAKTEDEKAAAAELVGAGADMSKPAGEDIELANQAAASANARAEEAMRRVAEAEWRTESAALLGAGVPPHAIDLAKPVLNRAEDMVIDLSNTDEEDVNVSTVVRGLLDALKGTVDLSNEEGHNGTHSGGEDPDKAVLDQWLSEF